MFYKNYTVVRNRRYCTPTIYLGRKLLGVLSFMFWVRFSESWSRIRIKTQKAPAHLRENAAPQNMKCVSKFYFVAMSATLDSVPDSRSESTDPIESRSETPVSWHHCFISSCFDTLIFVNFLFEGVLGLQNCGKSSILNVLAKCSSDKEEIFR